MYVASIPSDLDGTTETYTWAPRGTTSWKVLFREDSIRSCLVTVGSCGGWRCILTTRCSPRPATTRTSLYGGDTNCYGQRRYRLIVIGRLNADKSQRRHSRSALLESPCFLHTSNKSLKPNLSGGLRVHLHSIPSLRSGSRSWILRGSPPGSSSRHRNGRSYPKSLRIAFVLHWLQSK